MATFDFMSASSEDMSERSNGSVGRLMVMGLLLLPDLVTNSILYYWLFKIMDHSEKVWVFFTNTQTRFPSIVLDCDLA